jgi:myo-inositol-1(or 4)-monophosphatase
MPLTDSDPENPELLRSVRELAERAARAGGRVARESFQGSHTVRRKSDGSEVTDADEAAQAAVIATIQASRCDDPIIAEETPAAGRRAGGALSRPVSHDELCWVVDPIDGTRNYIRSVPYYSVSVAAMFAGFPVAGAIYVPETDEVYSVGGPDGPTYNGRRLSPTAATTEQVGRSPKPLVGIPSSLHGAAYAVMQDWFSRVVIRSLGSTAMHLALVATGQFRAALISDGRLWDIAAGWLLIKSTGGVMTTLEGEPIFPLDVARYAGEPIPSLASCDPETHGRLLPVGYPPF